VNEERDRDDRFERIIFWRALLIVLAVALVLVLRGLLG
jgi:predicted nucleic acid-binding Zn ribbon protein